MLDVGHRIARYHNDRITEDRIEQGVGAAHLHDDAALLPVFDERLAGQTFAGGCPHDAIEVVARRVERAVIERRLEQGRTCGVGIGLGRHIHAVSSRLVNGPEEVRDVERPGIGAAAAVDVDHVERGTGRHRIGQHLLKAGIAADAATRPADVSKADDSSLGAELEVTENFEVRRTGRVGDAHPDAECAVIECFAKLGTDGRNGGRIARRVRPGRRCITGALLVRDQRIAICYPAGVKVRSGSSIVDASLSRALGVEPGNGADAGLQFQGRGYAVHGVVAVALVVLTVRVEVDESRRDDEAAGIDGIASAERGAADRSDPAVADAQVTDCVQPGRGIHDPAMQNDPIVDAGLLG